MFTISSPLLLIAIPIIVTIWYIFFRERIGVTHPNPLIAKHLRTPNRIWLLWIIRLLMITCLILALVGIGLQRIVTTEKKISQDIMIVFDISLSMLAEDIQPSRIEAAKNILSNFIISRKGDRIGLIIFAGKPFISVPFSSDYRGILSIVSGLTPYLIRQDLPGLSGTNIGDALLLANMAHSGSENPSKSIILMTDGRANVGIDPIVSSTESLESGIQIYPVGIGASQGADLYYTDAKGQKTYFYDGKGNILKSDLDVPMMQKIADTTGGQYFQGDNRILLEQVFANIEKNLPNQTETLIENKTIDLTPLFLFLFVLGVGAERWYLASLMRYYRLV